MVLTRWLGRIAGLIRDQRGGNAAEYGLILAIVTAGVAVSAANLGNTISGAMHEASDCLAEAATTEAGNCNAPVRKEDPVEGGLNLDDDPHP